MAELVETGTADIRVAEVGRHEERMLGDEHIVAAFAVDAVLAGTAVEQIPAGAGKDQVVPVFAVVAAVSVDDVVTAVGNEEVATAAADEHVRAHRAVNHVVARAAEDCLADRVRVVEDQGDLVVAAVAVDVAYLLVDVELGPVLAGAEGDVDERVERAVALEHELEPVVTGAEVDEDRVEVAVDDVLFVTEIDRRADAAVVVGARDGDFVVALAVVDDDEGAVEVTVEDQLCGHEQPTFEWVDHTKLPSCTLY